jgi:hypothetical protein
MGLLSQLFGFLKGPKRVKSTKPQTQRTTADHPAQIWYPRIGFLNLQGAGGAEIAAADQRILSPLFDGTETSMDVVPKCEVLFLYCTIDADGKAEGCSVEFRDLIKAAGAYVAVVASENALDGFGKALDPQVGKDFLTRVGYDWFANVIFVVDRKGDKLATFLGRVFEQMFNGQSMLMAWVKLAPQIPGAAQPDLPSTVLTAQAGHLVFARNARD